MDFDLIHAHDRIFSADIFTMHGIPHRFWIRNVRKKRTMSLYDRATVWVEKKMVLQNRNMRFLAVSSLAREIFLQEYPLLDPRRVIVINPGVDAFAFPGGRKIYGQKIRTEFGIEPSSTLFLFVSMNFEIKGLDQLIRGLGELRRQCPQADFSLLVVGKGNQRVYRSLAAESGISEKVFFASEIPRERIQEVYAAGDIFVMLSKFDTFGLVVLEAMSASLPVVISGNVGARDIVREGLNGFVIEDTADAKRISEKIAHLLDEKIRAQMGKEALRTARANTWEAAAGRVTKIYEEILQSPVSAKTRHP